MDSRVDTRDMKEVMEETKKTERALQIEKRRREVHEAVERNVRERRDKERITVDSQVGETLLELEEDVDDAPDPTFRPQAKNTSNQTRMSMHHFAAETRRYFVGERAGAALWNAVIKDLEEAGVIKGGTGDTEITESLTVDRYKCRRELKKFGSLAHKNENMKLMNDGGLKCIGSDGKQDRKRQDCGGG